MSINNNSAIRYGNQALTDFQNLMVEKFEDDYQDTLEDLKNRLQARNPDFLIELGKAVYTSGFGQRRIAESMERVVAKINDPKENFGIMNFTNGIAEESSSFDFSLLSDAALSISEDIGQASKEVSEGIGGFFKKFGLGIPVVALIVVFLLFVFKDVVSDIIKGKILG